MSPSGSGFEWVTTAPKLLFSSRNNLSIIHYVLALSPLQSHAAATRRVHYSPSAPSSACGNWPLTPGGRIPELVLSQCTLEPPLPQRQVGPQVRGAYASLLLGHHPPPSGADTLLPRCVSSRACGYDALLYGIFRIALLQAVSLKLFPDNYEITYCQKMDGGSL